MSKNDKMVFYKYDLVLCYLMISFLTVCYVNQFHTNILPFVQFFSGFCKKVFIIKGKQW